MTKTDTKMYSTKVVNESKVEYTLKEGNARMYSLFSQLAPEGGTYTIKCQDPNDPYRVYWVWINQAKVETIISSDDCMEFGSIRIKDDASNPSRAKIEKSRRDLYETEVINDTSTDFTVKRQGGDGGAAKAAEDLATLAPKDGRYTIRYDPTISNATYLVGAGAATPIKISSIDLIKNKKIHITPHGTSGKTRLKRVPRENGNIPWWSRIKRVLGLG